MVIKKEKKGVFHLMIIMGEYIGHYFSATLCVAQQITPPLCSYMKHGRSGLALGFSFAKSGIEEECI